MNFMQLKLKHFQGDLLSCFPPFLLELCWKTVDPVLISWPIYQVSKCHCFSFTFHILHLYLCPVNICTHHLWWGNCRMSVCRAGSQHLKPTAVMSHTHTHTHTMLLPQRISSSSSASRQATIEQSWTWTMSVHIYETHKVKVMNMEVKTVYFKETVDWQQ